MGPGEAKSDADCVRGALAGDDGCFRILVERYEHRAFWTARGLLGNDEDCRDAAQEAFLRIYRGLHTFDPKRRFSTWLYRIVVNVCIDHLRKARHRKAPSLEQVGEPAAPPSGGCALEQAELKGRVERILATLPPIYRSVMVLADLEGLDSRKIGEIMNIPRTTARWRHHRARQLFREAWKAAYGKTSGRLLLVGG